MTPVCEKKCQKCGETFQYEPGDGRRNRCTSCKQTKAESARERYLKNIADRKVKMRVYYLRNQTEIRKLMRERWRQTRESSPWKHIMQGAKHRAKVGNFVYDLTEEWAKERWTGRCEMTGIEFQLGLATADVRMFAPSVDRIKPQLGYTRENCRFILFAVNAMKQDGTDADVFRIAKGIVKRLRRSYPLE
jgi:hypothetical protein